MRLLNFLKHEDVALGARTASGVIDLSEVAESVDELLELGEEAMAEVRRIVAAGGPVLSLDDLAPLPPVLAPDHAIAVGLNYIDHAAESPYKDAPKYPVLFHRFPSSWVAHGEPLVRPRVSEQFDYEAELAVIIGAPGRYIAKEEALGHVFGYSLFNDGSIRDYQFKSHQWMIGKNFDQTASFGPELVTADELPPGAAGLRIQCRLNGAVLQDANTRDMIFDVATLVATCSEVMELQPGDVIISGTPAGVGFARKPPIFMKAGDVVEVEVEGIGVLRNPVVDE